MLYGAAMTMTDGHRLERLLGKANRAKFARDHKIKGGDSMISQHVSGHRPISLEAAIAYARAFRCPIADVSPEAAALIASASALPQVPLSAAEPSAPYSVPPTVQEALEVLGIELAKVPPDMREAVASNLAGWARDGGRDHWRGLVLALLEAQPTKQRRAG